MAILVVFSLFIPASVHPMHNIGNWYVEWEKIFPEGHAQFCQPIGDADNDGKNEIVVGGFRDENVTILKWNESLQSYEAEAKIREEGAYAGGAAIGDLKGNGKNELAIVWNNWDDENKSGACVYKWNGHQYEKLQFIHPENFWIYYDCYIGDYNGDGKNELLLFGWVNYGPEIIMYGWDNNAKNLKEVAAWDDPDGTSYKTFIPSIYISDVDGDGMAEIICGPGQTLVVVNVIGNEFNYTVVHKWRGMDIWTYGVAAGDINEDGIPEIIVGLGGRAHNIPTAYMFEYNPQTMKYEEVWNKTWDGEKNVVEAVDIGDADNDGRMEACIATDHIHIIGWNGIRYYEEATINETYGILPGIHVGDCDNDGKNEILTGTLRETEGLPYKEWVFKYANSDNTPPWIKVERPRNYLYLFDKEIMPTPFPIVIGRITVKANAGDNESGIRKVEIYLDGSLEKTLYAPPYQWRLDKTTIGMHELTIVAYNNAENVAYHTARFFALM